MAGPLLAVARAHEELFHRLLVAVALESGEVFRRRRQADEVEVEPAAERGGIGRRRGLHLLLRQVVAHERVDRRGGTGRGGHDGLLRRDERPVRVVTGPRGDPFLEEPHLLLCERLLLVRRRHDHVGISGPDPGHDLALVGLARHDRGLARIAPFEGVLADVEPQAPLPSRFVDPVAVGAMLGEERLDLPLEVGASSLGRPGGEQADQAAQGDQRVCYEALGRMHGDTLGTVNIGKTVRMTEKY